MYSYDYPSIGIQISLCDSNLYPKGVVIFEAGYRGGRIFGGVPNHFASSNWGIKILCKNYKVYDGL